MDYQNCDPFIATIIADGKATLKELNNDYSFEDAYYLWEIIVTTRFNEYLAAEHAKKNQGKGM